jgi:hypothetical protein
VLDREGKLRIIDLSGSAWDKREKASDEQPRVKRREIRSFTSKYRSDEMIGGPDTWITGAADVYSFGAMLRELVQETDLWSTQRGVQVAWDEWLLSFDILLTDACSADEDACGAADPPTSRTASAVVRHPAPLWDSVGNRDSSFDVFSQSAGGFDPATECCCPRYAPQQAC